MCVSFCAALQRLPSALLAVKFRNCFVSHCATLQPLQHRSGAVACSQCLCVTLNKIAAVAITFGSIHVYSFSYGAAATLQILQSVLVVVIF